MNIKRFAKKHSVLVTTLAIIAIVLMTVAGRVATKKAVEVSKSNLTQVTLAPARTFRDDLSKVAVDGVVESSSQVDIKSQVSAPISVINYSIGDYVSAGQTIVQLQNADIRAQLEQARANLELARGLYLSGPVAIDTSQRTAIEKIKDSYIKADTIINSQISPFLYSGNPNTEKLEKYIVNSRHSDAISIKWTEVQNSMGETKKLVDKLGDNSTQTDIDIALAASEKNLKVVQDLLNLLSSALVDAANYANEETQTLLDGWKAIVTAGRTTISAAISSLTSTGTGLSSNQAQISAAEAGVRNLEAQLAKTIITAPISGTIAALPSRVGEFVGMGQLITTIVGQGGLEVKAYASSEDVDRIKKDAKVTVEGNIPGVVVSVAPSVNPATKKVEVKIRIPAGEKAGLVVGQSVEAKIEAAGQVVTSRKPLYLLPIQNVKIVPGEAYVYTLDENKKVVKNKVILGNVSGDFVEVKEGLTDEMEIVSPVYELEEGQEVRVE